MFEGRFKLRSPKDRSTVTVTFRGRSNFDGEPAVAGSGEARERALEVMRLGPGAGYPLRVRDPMREWPALRYALLGLSFGLRPLEVLEDTGPGETPRPDGGATPGDF